MADKIFTTHGIKFKRTGECNRCGACNCEKFNCRHFSWNEQGLATCDIQNSKIEICQDCSQTNDSDFYQDGKEVTHKMCEDFPNHPWLNVIKSGKCNYKFEPHTKVDEVKFNNLNKIWQ